MNDHQPVLLDEVIDALRVQPSGQYIDATFGRGGHARAILAQLGPEGRLLALDRDPEACAAARSLFDDDPRVRVEQASFAGLQRVADLHLEGGADGLLLDIGVSSPQLDDPRRGFSFREDGPLDMRMDPGTSPDAAAWLAGATERDISLVLRRLGEERFHRRIARAIVATREHTPITRTLQLATIVASAVPVREPGRHPATRTFQALRIHVNGELEQLEAALDQSLGVLAPAGVLCVISFHSLEDRIVKRFMRRQAQPDPAWAGLPDIPEHARPALMRPRRPVRAGADEVSRNPRARSAVLRVTERLS